MGAYRKATVSRLGSMFEFLRVANKHLLALLQGSVLLGKISEILTFACSQVGNLYFVSMAENQANTTLVITANPGTWPAGKLRASEAAKPATVQGMRN